MKIHIDSVHERKKPFKCNICDASFAVKGNLKKHLASVHEGKKPFTCNFCDTSFREKGSLKKHTASVHERKKPFKCSVCDTSFAVRGNLNKHATFVMLDASNQSMKIHIDSVYEGESLSTVTFVMLALQRRAT